MALLDRYRVVVRGQSAKATTTRRTAEQYAQLARDRGSPAHVEPTQICETCGLHRCSGEPTCLDR